LGHVHAIAWCWFPWDAHQLQAVCFPNAAYTAAQSGPASPLNMCCASSAHQLVCFESSWWHPVNTAEENWGPVPSCKLVGVVAWLVSDTPFCCKLGLSVRVQGGGGGGGGGGMGPGTGCTRIKNTIIWAKFPVCPGWCWHAEAWLAVAAVLTTQLLARPGQMCRGARGVTYESTRHTCCTQPCALHAGCCACVSSQPCASYRF
jgi:hypothetical protein